MINVLETRCDGNTIFSVVSRPISINLCNYVHVELPHELHSSPVKTAGPDPLSKYNSILSTLLCCMASRFGSYPRQQVLKESPSASPTGTLHCGWLFHPRNRRCPPATIFGTGAAHDMWQSGGGGQGSYCC